MSEIDPGVDSPQEPAADVNVAPAGEPAPPPAAAPAPKKSRKGIFFIGALSGCLVLFAGILLVALVVAYAKDDGNEFSLEKVAIVPIEGEIFEAREAIDTLHRYADNSM